MNTATLQSTPSPGVSRSDAYRLIGATGPDLEDLFQAAAQLRERLAVYPEYVRGRIQCLSEPLRARVRALSDETGPVRREEERW